jgi:hypothetical protein
MEALTPEFEALKCTSSFCKIIGMGMLWQVLQVLQVLQVPVVWQLQQLQQVQQVQDCCWNGIPGGAVVIAVTASSRGRFNHQLLHWLHWQLEVLPIARTPRLYLPGRQLRQVLPCECSSPCS